VATAGETAAETAAMRRAVRLAAQGVGMTSPNPVVGCVIVDSAGACVGEGFHERAGGPHAEIMALRQAGSRACGATAVVTLEPCNHTGRTAPCSHALVAAGVSRVVVAVRDPHPAAAGGIDTLLDAGVDVEVGLLAEEAERVNEPWLTSVRRRRPYVIWKYGASLDGRVAAADGSSRWVTGSAARADAHRLRAESDAVLVGSGTVLADDPHLAVRKAQLRRGQPLRVVLDTHARTPPSARVLDDAAPTLVAVAEDADATALAKAGAQVLRAPRAPAGPGLDLLALLAALHERQIVTVLLEGGPTLAGSFVAEGLVDRVVAYLAPVLIGGGGRPALTGAGAPTIEAVRRLRVDDVTRIGPDVRITARPTAWKQSSSRETEKG
jgi:diaminohydroxyphosphoribosylaminopyrimidine deaminase/5-amino-6-(5-phosphoribosylamino)uracil reductase